MYVVDFSRISYITVCVFVSGCFFPTHHAFVVGSMEMVACTLLLKNSIKCMNRSGKLDVCACPDNTLYNICNFHLNYDYIFGLVSLAG